MRPFVIAGVSLLMLTGAALAAQADEILLIERSKDGTGRDRLARAMSTTRMNVTAESISATEIAKLLAIAMNNEWNFTVFAKDPKEPEWPAIGLDLRQARVLNVLGVVQRLSDIRFVFRDGLVMLKPKDEIGELKVLRTYNLRHAVAPLRDRPGPRLGLSGVTDEFIEPEVDDSKTLSGFTIDKIQDVLRNNVDPESWDEDGVTMSETNGTLMIRHTDRAHRKIQKTLAVLGVWHQPRPIVRPARSIRRVPAPGRTTLPPATKPRTRK